MIQFFSITTLLVATFLSETGFSDLSQCSVLEFETPRSLNLDQSLQPSQIALRFADEFVTVQSSRLDQPIRHCKCDDNEAMSLESEECKQVFYSLEARYSRSSGQNFQRMSPFEIHLKPAQISSVESATHDQLRVAREIFQKVSAFPPEKLVSRMLKELKLPVTFASTLQKIVDAVSINGPGFSPLLKDSSLQEYPFFTGIHALDMRSGFDSESDFSIWPHSVRGIERGVELSQAAGELSVPNEEFARMVIATAREWTASDGSAVILVPDGFKVRGEFDRFLTRTLLPIVTISDLRQDEDGSIYLQIKDGSNVERVTAIVSPMSDDELLQTGERLEQGSRPMYQQFADNAELAKNMQRTLLPGVWYDYVFDEAGKTIGVRTDSNNELLLKKGSLNLQVNEEVSPGIDIGKALVNHKLFVQNLGLAVLRNPLVTHSLNRIGNYRTCITKNDGDFRKCVHLATENSLATLSPEPKYLIDLIDESGRQKRYDFAQMTRETRQQVVSTLLSAHRTNSRQHFVINERHTPMIAMDIIESGDGSLSIVDRVASIRFYTSFGSEGTVKIFENRTVTSLAPVASYHVGFGTHGPYAARTFVDRESVELQFVANDRE